MGEEQKRKISATSGLILESEEVKDDSDSDEDGTDATNTLQGTIGGDGQPQGKLVAHILATAGKGKEKETEEKGGPFNFKRLPSARPGNRSEGLFSKQQIELLAAQIQAIGQSASPLGKCIDYVYEDIEQMQTELAKWRKDYQQQTAELETELRKHEVNIAEQNKKIFAMKAQIFRNDKALEKLVDRKSDLVRREEAKDNSFSSGF